MLEAAYCQYAAFCLIKSLQIITESLAGNKVRQGFVAEIFVFFEWGGYFASNMRAYLLGCGDVLHGFCAVGLGWLAVIICFLFTGLDDGLC